MNKACSWGQAGQHIGVTRNTVAGVIWRAERRERARRARAAARPVVYAGDRSGEAVAS